MGTRVELPLLTHQFKANRAETVVAAAVIDIVVAAVCIAVLTFIAVGIRHRRCLSYCLQLRPFATIVGTRTAAGGAIAQQVPSAAPFASGDRRRHF